MKRKASLSAFGRARRLPAWSRFAVPAAMAGVAVALVGCTVMPPSGPSVVALPPKGKSLTEFQQEDYACRDYAFRSTDSAGAAQGATANSVNSAALGTVGGAAAGALLGAAAGNAGAGAAIGAGSGLLLGSAVGANGAQYASGGLQARYDAAYAQCMTSKGNTISPPAYATPMYGQPVYGQPMYAAPPVIYRAPPPPVYYYAPPAPWYY
ncbi:conserved protein of unknown function [Paraburkholderia kururiensis]|uniref:glycine zipper family protein n=2 Tax=Burkholderiaceae TaxID=119060 RepID=UPI000F896E59